MNYQQQQNQWRDYKESSEKHHLILDKESLPYFRKHICNRLTNKDLEKVYLIAKLEMTKRGLKT